MSNTATTTGIILALDLGQYKSVACADHGDPAAATFTGLTTDREHLTRLFARHRPTAVVIEACLLAGWVHDLCHDLGLPCHVANTASEAWKFKHTKRKTDKDDALRLAPLFALGQLPTLTVPPPATRQGRTLIAGRQALVGRRVAVQNRIRAILGGQRLPAPRGVKAWTVPGLEGIGRFAKPLAACAGDELWRGRLDLALAERRQVRALADQAEARLDRMAKESADVQLVETAPGVGPRTAEASVAHLHQPGRFASGKQVSAYVGLVPRQYQSGELDRKGRITRRGPAILRKLLVECAGAMLRSNAWARAVYLRLSRGQARKKQAIVAWRASCWCAAGPCSGTRPRGATKRRPNRRRRETGRHRVGGVVTPNQRPREPVAPARSFGDPR